MPPPADLTTSRDPEITSIADPVEAEIPKASHERPETPTPVDVYLPSPRATAWDRSRTSRFRLSPGLILLVVLVVLIGVLSYRFLDELAAWHAAEREQLVDPTGLLIDIPPAESYQKQDGNDTGAAGVREAASPPARAVTEPTPPADLEAAGAEPAAEPPPPLTQIRLITWKELEDRTVVTLVGDGVLQPDDYSHLRLVGSPPRELVRLRGIDWPFREPILRVGTREVQRLRTGFHPGQPRNELHIVVDLSSAAVELSKIEIEGRRIYLHLTQRVTSRES